MSLPDASPDSKSLILGTALWGWGVDRDAAFAILEYFLANGGRIVDTAANYPINKRPEDFGLAARWLSEWINANGTADISILVKVGAKDNMGSPAADLGRDSILRSESAFRALFGMALGALSIHWDNRGDDENDSASVEETVSTLAGLWHSGLSIGLSGIRRPDLYVKAVPGLASEWWIQVKENIRTRQARLNYEKSFPNARYLAYGINMGGLKATPHDVHSSLALRGLSYPAALTDRLSRFMAEDHGLTPAPKDFNELALFAAYANPSLSGIIIGPRNMDQLEKTMSYWATLKRANRASPEAIAKIQRLSD